MNEAKTSEQLYSNQFSQFNSERKVWKDEIIETECKTEISLEYDYPSRIIIAAGAAKAM